MFFTMFDHSDPLLGKVFFLNSGIVKHAEKKQKRKRKKRKLRKQEGREACS